MSNETTRVRALRASLMAALVAFVCACTLAFAAPQSAWADATSMPDANNGVITLAEDVTLSSAYTVASGTTVTIDLNGHNITASNSCAIVNKGTLTITGSGTVSTSATQSAAVANANGATCELKGGTYESASWYVLRNMGEMSITGDVTVQKPASSTDTSSLIENGWYGNTGNDRIGAETSTHQAGQEAKLTISSGTFNGTSGAKSCSVVKNDDYGTLVISGGTFDSTSNTGTTDATTIINWNVATISGGTFTGSYPISNGAYTGESDKGQLTISGGTFTGSTKVLGNALGGSGTGTLTITGGTFTNNDNDATVVFSETTKSNSSDLYYEIKASGGTFSQPVPDSCIDGELVNLTSDGDTFTLGSVDNAVAKVTLPTQTDSTDAVSAIYFTTKEAAEDYVKANGSTPVTYLKYTLTFDSQGGSAVESQVLNAAVSGQTAGTTTKPADPTREGYAFKGWYTEAACTNEFTFGNELKEDTTVYAKWAQTHTVTFIVSTGADPQTQTVEHGSTVTKPTDPTLDGYTFVGWFTDSTFTTAYDFSTQVTADTTIYGGWQENASSSDGSTDESTATAKSSSAKTGDASGAAAAALAGLALCSAGAIALARRKQD